MRRPSGYDNTSGLVGLDGMPSIQDLTIDGQRRDAAIHYSIWDDLGQINQLVSRTRTMVERVFFGMKILEQTGKCRDRLFSLWKLMWCRVPQRMGRR